VDAPKWRQKYLDKKAAARMKDTAMETEEAPRDDRMDEDNGEWTMDLSLQILSL
jgi:hypothetical protein